MTSVIHRPLSDAGFSLLELLVIVGIISVLALISLPVYSRLTETAKVSRAKNEIRILEKEINAYVIDMNFLPASLNDIGRGALRDPWGNLYQYTNFAGGGAPRTDGPFEDLNEEFDLYSSGADGSSLPDITELVSQDDVFRAGDGGWVGLGKDY